MNLPLVLLNRRRRGGLDTYREGGFNPALVFDFDDEYYRTGGSTSTFSSAITHSRTSNATMVDSDGLLKWEPHNLALNSATPATQSITVISGADYTVECTGVSIALSGAGSGTVTEGNPITITASTTTLTLTVTGSTGTMWAYRSDLGGMVNNPDRGDSYVPTTSSARYLARRGHHIWNGSAWVNEGMLHESEARTNLLTYSEDFTQWTNGNTVDVGGQANSLTGNNDATLLYPASNGVNRFIYRAVSGASNIYTRSVFAKAQSKSVFYIDPTGNGTVQAFFDLSTGTVGTVSAGYEARIEPFGGGWYRCSVYNVTAATLVFGGVYGVADADGSTSVTANGTDGIYIYGAQLEAAPTPSSYIPTSGATVTRAADTLTVPSANLPWSSDAVSIQMQGRATGNTYTTTRWYLDANNYITQEINSSDFTFEQAASGTVDAVTGGSFTSGVNTSFNIASRHGSTFVNGAVDGAALTADTTPTALPDLSSTDLNLGFDYMGTIKLFRIWAADLADAGVAEASIPWLVSSGYWDDAGIWADIKLWTDGA